MIWCQIDSKAISNLRKIKQYIIELIIDKLQIFDLNEKI